MIAKKGQVARVAPMRLLVCGHSTHENEEQTQDRKNHSTDMGQSVVWNKSCTCGLAISTNDAAMTLRTQYIIYINYPIS